MDDRLRSAAAQVLVDHVDAPELGDRDRHHLLRVLRLRDGELVVATDGRGSWQVCRLYRGELDPDGAGGHVPAPERPITVAAATPKGDRAEWMVQKCTEIGVDRIVLLAADRSVVRWGGERADRHSERLQRIVVEAAMQSRRVWLPELVGPIPAGPVLVDVPVAEPGGRALTADDTAVAIGPEGGWSPAELAVAADTVSLGPHILRVETAAVVAAALMVAHREAREARQAGTGPEGSGT